MLVELQVSIQDKPGRVAEQRVATLPNTTPITNWLERFLTRRTTSVKTQAYTFLANTKSIYQDNINAYHRVFPRPSDTDRLIGPCAQELNHVFLAGPFELLDYSALGSSGCMSVMSATVNQHYALLDMAFWTCHNSFNWELSRHTLVSARLLLVVYQLLKQLESQRKHAFLHRGVRPTHALKQLQPRVETPHELMEVLMEILFVAAYTSHPTPWPCRVTHRLSRPRDEPSVQMAILAPTMISVSRHLNECAVGLDPPAYAHPGTCQPDARTNSSRAG
jgi:hypothetical protein